MGQLSSSAIRLLSPGEIRESTKSARKYPLNQCLELQSDYYPFMWLDCASGVFVLSRSEATKVSPLNLHFVNNYRFDTIALLPITDKLPSFTEWVQRPLLSEQGLFLASQNSLHYFPTHGFDSTFPYLQWQPARGERILAIGLEESGHPLLLISDAHDKHLILLRGNPQAQTWGERKEERISLGLPAREGGYIIGVSETISDLGWIYDGVTLVLVNLSAGEVWQAIELSNVIKSGDAVKPAVLFDSRIGNGYFDPFFIRPFGTGPMFVFPLKTKSRKDDITRVVPGILGLSTQAPQAARMITLEESNSWVLPDPWRQGLLVGSKTRMERFQGVSSVEQAKHTADFSEVSPLLLAECFVAQAKEDISSGASGDTQQVHLCVFATELKSDRYNVRLLARPLLPMGTQIGGMPPLYSTGDVFVALRQGVKDNAPIIVDAIQIAQK